MKFNKLLGILILEFISATAFANLPHKFYVAADAGIFQGDFNNQFIDHTDFIAQNIVQPATQYGYTGGIALGYSRLMSQNYFIGGEISANINTNNASFQSGASNTTFSDKVQINDHFDLTFVPGLILSNNISTYLKLGISYALIEDHLTSPAGFDSITVGHHSNNNPIGFAAGLGISKSFPNRITLFTEANYHDYGTIEFTNFQNFMATYSHSTHVYSYDVVVGLAYSI